MTRASAIRHREDERFAIKAIKARRRGQKLSPRELGGLVRTYYRAVGENGVWLYAIQAGDDGPVKIGKTVNPADRLKTLQTGNPAELKGLAAWRALALEEDQLHQEFAHARIRGEWFQPVPGLLELVGMLGGSYCDWDKGE